MPSAPKTTRTTPIAISFPCSLRPMRHLRHEWRAPAESLPLELTVAPTFIDATSQLDGSKSAEARHETHQRQKMAVQADGGRSDQRRERVQVRWIVRPCECGRGLNRAAERGRLRGRSGSNRNGRGNALVNGGYDVGGFERGAA